MKTVEQKAILDNIIVTYGEPVAWEIATLYLEEKTIRQHDVNPLLLYLFGVLDKVGDKSANTW